ncbi:hypothetical protein PG996_007183 [Apiospora saccharicola]|uniref:NOL1/NOP2/Sun domain family member 4 n=1 Tax=Apiospora saccharicola TaxID=335842 RepID=A0ABR1VA46_9PEZI
MPGLTKAQVKLVEAAEHSFGRIYAAQYGEQRWRDSLRPALLKNTRYAMLVNRYQAAEIPSGGVFAGDNDQENLQAIDFFPPPSDKRPSSAPSPDSTMNPQAPRLIAYKRGDLTDPSQQQQQQQLVSADEPFPAPQVTIAPDGSKRLTTHWNLDAASLLPVRLLNPVPGDKVLDLCAAPGGKSLALAQLLRPPTFDDPDVLSLAGGCLHSNEMDNARHKRLTANLETYLPLALLQRGEVKVLKLDGADPLAVLSLPHRAGGYDKVLLDAPCSSERHVLHAHARAQQAGKMADEMALWRSGQSKKTAKLQAALLMTALRAVKVGGRVVYATCSLSGEENDGVIEKGKELVQKDKKKLGAKWDVAVRKGVSVEEAEWLESNWAERTKHGWIVLPDHPSGGRWGPLFFAVLEKIPV